MRRSSLLATLGLAVPLMLVSASASAALYNISGVVVNLPTQPTPTTPLQLSGSFANVQQIVTGTTFLSGNVPVFDVGSTLAGKGDIVTLGAAGQSGAITCATNVFISNPFCNLHFTFTGFNLTSVTEIGTFKKNTFTPTGVEYYYSGGTVSVFLDTSNNNIKDGTLWLQSSGVDFYTVNEPPPNQATLAASVSYSQNSAQGNTALNINGGSAAGNFVTANAVDFFTQINFLNASTNCQFTSATSQTCMAGSGTLSTLLASNATPYTPPSPPLPTPVSLIASPASLALFGVGLLGLGFIRRRRASLSN